MKQIIKYSFILILIDQIIKISISNISNITIIKNFFNITYVENTGAAFSILQSKRILLIIVAFVAIFLLYHYLIKNKDLKKIEILIYSLLIGGIIGNLIDRIVYGYVIDYLEFIILNHYMPIFNFADICIVIGTILFLYETIKEDKNARIYSK